MSSKSWRETNRNRQNELWRNWYAKNAKKKIGWQRRRRLEIRRWFRALKATMACEECGERSPECLHFHHRDPATKCFSLGQAAATGNLSKRRILAEIAKCRVLCANCHMKEHWLERRKKSG